MAQIELMDYIEGLDEAAEVGDDMELMVKSGDGLAKIPASLFRSSPGGYALSFTGDTHHQRINCGAFWDRSIAHGKFFCDAWVKVSGTMTGYIISDGYGGSHNILFGLTGTGVGPYTVTGNVRIGGASVSFSSADKIYAGDWHYVAAEWDESNIRVWIDGVITKVVAATGDRQTTGDASEGVLYVGGSNHSNLNALLRAVRIIEGDAPIAATGSFRPEQSFRSAYVNSAGDVVDAAYLADLTTPQTVIADLGGGYANGGSVRAKHPGFLESGEGTDTGTFTRQSGAEGMIANLPQFVDAEFEAPSVFRGSPLSVPGDAVVFDDFSRANVTRTWVETLTPGTSRTGQVWEATDVGIIDGCAYAHGAGGGTNKRAVIEHGSATQNVTITRKSGSDENSWIILRYTDANNYIYCNIVSGQYADIRQYLAGVESQLTSLTGSGDAGTAWNELGLRVNGTTVVLSVDGVDNLTGTTTVASGTKCGMLFGSALARIETFAAE